jgi:maltooligosyltrehalose trehalohydrolase
VLHVLLTGERDGYYADYHPALPLLGRCLTEGFAYQGDWSSYRGHPRGDGSRHLPPTAFVDFLQNHDQIGNRAFGERITELAPAAAVRAATAVLLLAPATPLLFMGQEWAAREPFLFFSDLGPDLGPAVSEGRRREFARFPRFADPDARARIPDPQAEATRDRSVLDWSALSRPEHAEWLALHRALLAIRRAEIAPLLAGEPVPRARWRPLGPTALEAEWVFDQQRASPSGGGRVLTLVANLGAEPATIAASLVREPARRLYALNIPADPAAPPPAWSVAWTIQEGRAMTPEGVR